MSCTPRSRPATRLLVPGLALLAGLGAGCSSGDGGSGGSDADLSGPSAAPTLQIEPVSRLGEVTGRLPRKDARTVEEHVSRIAERWLTDAYVGGSYPRVRFGAAFADFSRGARSAARRDLRVMSNAGIGERIDRVTPTRMDIEVDLLAVDRRAVGATAHVLTTFRTAGREQGRFRVAGRLLLTKEDGHWTVFAYHVSKGDR